MKVTNTSAGAVIYDDEVTGKQRKISAGETTWIQPSANLPIEYLTVISPSDGYGKYTRRVFVSAADVSTTPAKYTPNSLGQAKYIDEFIGVGETEPLAGKLFKRSTFTYTDLNNATKWTTITETEQREPA